MRHTKHAHLKKVIYPIILGRREYEESLHVTRIKLEEKKDDTQTMDELTKVKCLINLNLVYMRARDLPIDESCLGLLESSLIEFNRDDLTQADLICKENLQLLVDFIKKNMSGLQNNKVNKLVDIVLKCHEETSKGNLAYDSLC